jgi:hypothetical protein
MWSCFPYICDVRMYLWCLLVVVAAISWLFQDATPDGCKILVGSRMPPASSQITVGVAYWSVINGLHSERPLQTCPQCNGQCKSLLPVLTGGPQELARSSRYRRRRLKASVSFNSEKADTRRNRCVKTEEMQVDCWRLIIVSKFV